MIKMFDLRTPEQMVTIHDPEGELDHESVRGAVAMTGTRFPVTIATDLRDLFPVAVFAGTSGMTSFHKGRWYVHVDPRSAKWFPGEGANFGLNHVLWHEIGHVYDLTLRMQDVYGKVDAESYEQVTLAYNARYSYEDNPAEQAADRYAAEMASTLELTSGRGEPYKPESETEFLQGVLELMFSIPTTYEES